MDVSEKEELNRTIISNQIFFDPAHLFWMVGIMFDHNHIYTSFQNTILYISNIGKTIS
jgi:hypothetical protein